MLKYPYQRTKRIARAGVARLAVVVQRGAERLRDQHHRGAGQRHRDCGALPAHSGDQTRHQDAGKDAAQRHTGLLQRKHEAHQMRRRGTRQDVRAGRCHRPVAGANQQGAQGHSRQRAAGRTKQAGRAQQQADLADADGAITDYPASTEETGHHRTEIDQRDVDTNQRHRPGQLASSGRCKNRHGERGHRGKRLDRQRHHQREKASAHQASP